MRLWPGQPFPLGPLWDGQGTNFSLFSEHAEKVELCLFDESGRETRYELTERTASLGSVHTMVVHPPSTSQRQLSDEELLASGIRPGLLRVSVGLEDIDDLVADFERGLAVARRVAASAPSLVDA